MAGVTSLCFHRIPKKEKSEMSSYNEQLLHIVEQYRSTGDEWPASRRQIARWAMDNHLWEPHPSTMLDQFARELGRAMREEYITDPQGRRVRAKHAARIKKEGGEEQYLWGDIRDRERTFMEASLQHRRGGVAQDCRQLKVDLDSFNENFNDGQPIQLSFDFTLDVEELGLALAQLN